MLYDRSKIKEQKLNLISAVSFEICGLMKYLFLMAATSRLTNRGFDSISISPRSYTFRARIQPFSFVANRFSTRVADFMRCKTTSRNIKVFGVRSMGSGSEPEEIVQKAIAENPIVVYSKTWCLYSVEVKSFKNRRDNHSKKLIFAADFEIFWLMKKLLCKRYKEALELFEILECVGDVMSRSRVA